MKVGDLVKVYERSEARPLGQWRIGLVHSVVSFSENDPDQPIVLIEGKLRLYGHTAVEVVDDNNKPCSSAVPTWLE